MKHRLVLSAIGAAVVIALGALYVSQGRQNGDRNAIATNNDQPSASVAQPSSPLGDNDAPSIVIGGVARPQNDFPSGALAGNSAPPSAGPVDGDSNGSNDSQAPFDFPDYGTSPAIVVDANVQVAAVAAALQSGKRPELLSPVIAPVKFDPAAYAKDPQAYLNSPEPGRVFASAQPGPDVAELQRQTGYYTPVLQGEKVNLRVQAPAGAPVSFTSFDLGLFSNQLTTITVAADDAGVATAEFLASPGTIAKVNVLAASPVTSGQVKFVVDISLPSD